MDLKSLIRRIRFLLGKVYNEKIKTVMNFFLDAPYRNYSICFFWFLVITMAMGRIFYVIWIMAPSYWYIIHVYSFLIPLLTALGFSLFVTYIICAVLCLFERGRNIVFGHEHVFLFTGMMGIIFSNTVRYYLTDIRLGEIDESICKLTSEILPVILSGSYDIWLLLEVLSLFLLMSYIASLSARFLHDRVKCDKNVFAVTTIINCMTFLLIFSLPKIVYILNRRSMESIMKISLEENIQMDYNNIYYAFLGLVIRADFFHVSGLFCTLSVFLSYILLRKRKFEGAFFTSIFSFLITGILAMYYNEYVRFLSEMGIFSGLTLLLWECIILSWISTPGFSPKGDHYELPIVSPSMELWGDMIFYYEPYRIEVMDLILFGISVLNLLSEYKKNVETKGEYFKQIHCSVFYFLLLALASAYMCLEMIGRTAYYPLLAMLIELKCVFGLLNAFVLLCLLVKNNYLIYGDVKS